MIFLFASALDEAKTKILNDIKPVVENVIIPVIDTFLVMFLVISIAKAAIAYKRHSEVDLTSIIIIVVGIILISTFKTWGWSLVP
jgi:hypothetical protein